MAGKTDRLLFRHTNHPLGLFFNLLNLHVFILCVVSDDGCGAQVFGGQFSPSTMWVAEIKLWSSGLAAGT